MTNKQEFSQNTDARAAAPTESAAPAKDRSDTAYLTASQRAALRRTATRLASLLLPFLLTLLFSCGTLLYDTNPLGIAFLCALGGAGNPIRFLSAVAGILFAAALGVHGAQTGLFLGALLLSVGIRYAVGRFLTAAPRHPGAGFGAARGRGRRYAEEDIPSTADRTAPADKPDFIPTPLWNAASALRRAAVFVFPADCFRADLGIRTGIAVLAAAPIAAGLLLSAENTPRGIAAAVFVLAVIPAFAWLFSGVTEGALSSPSHREAGIGACCFSLTAACGGVLLFGFSLRMLLCHALSLYVACRNGYLRGTLCGLLCGFACDALYAPAYALIGAAAGILWGITASPAPVVILSLVSGAAYAVYVGEFAAIRSVLPEMIAVSAVAYPILRYFPTLCKQSPTLSAIRRWIADLLAPYLSPASIPAAVPGSAAAEDMQAAHAPRPTITPEELGLPGPAQQLDALSGILSGLSTTFYHLSDRQKKPGLFEVRAMCEGIADGYCTGCGKHDVCWEENFSHTADAMGRITLSMYRRGRSGSHTTEDSGAHAFAPLDTACPHFAAMYAEMNEAAAALCEEKLKHDKTEVAAADYEGMAKLLRASAEDAAHACVRDDALSRRLGRVMQKLGFSAADISVYGPRRRTVIAHAVSLAGEAHPLRADPTLLGAEELRDAFSAVVGVRYRSPSFAIGDGGHALTMTLHAEPKLGVTSGCWGEKKAGEEITGDVLTVFSNRADYYYALLCDGMGSGREASVTAQIAALFLEKLLSVSCAKGAALNLLNSYLRARVGECSATVDLCELDMITGDAHFVKCGAAATYLLRGDSMFRIASSTAPLGILREVSSEETTFSLCDGDTLLFFSDGVCGECEDAAWIAAVLERAKEDYAKAEAREKTRMRTAAGENTADEKTPGKLPARCDYLARALGEEAKQRIGRADDMTVIYLEVHFLHN